MLCRGHSFHFVLKLHDAFVSIERYVLVLPVWIWNVFVLQARMSDNEERNVSRKRRSSLQVNPMPLQRQGAKKHDDKSAISKRFLYAGEPMRSRRNRRIPDEAGTTFGYLIEIALDEIGEGVLFRNSAYEDLRFACATARGLRLSGLIRSWRGIVDQVSKRNLSVIAFDIEFGHTPIPNAGRVE